RDAGAGGLRADQPARAAADRRGRAVDPSARRRDRERDLRRDRRAHPPRSVLARAGEVGAVVAAVVLLPLIPALGSGLGRPECRLQRESSSSRKSKNWVPAFAGTSG